MNILTSMNMIMSKNMLNNTMNMLKFNEYPDVYEYDNV